jgi:hypothetical protein
MQNPQGSRDEGEARPVAQASTPWANLALVVVSVLSSIALIEIGYRVARGLPVLTLANWRTEQVSFNRLGIAIADPVLGWTNSPWTDFGNFVTLGYGIRQNYDETTVRTGAVLAVGDSFTEGWDVEGYESWPAVLEEITGVPVVNAGIGGYGTDQIILRAEQLLPIVKPKILIVGFLEDDIFRTGYSIYSAAKPYFTIENGELRYHPPGPLDPREPGSLMSSIGYTLRDGLGYLATANYVLGRLKPRYWYGTEFSRRIDVDPVEVTCALLRRLKTQTDRENIRTILFMQYSAQSVLASNMPTREAQNVIACAKAAGMRVADQFSLLRSIALGGRDALKEHYVYYDNDFGHMSANGNWHQADVLSTELQDWLEAPSGVQ